MLIKFLSCLPQSVWLPYGRCRERLSLGASSGPQEQGEISRYFLLIIHFKAVRWTGGWKPRQSLKALRCSAGGQRVQSSVRKNRNKVCFGEERSSCLDLVIYLMEKPSDILALWFDWVLSDKADMEDKTCFLFCLGLFLRSVVFLSSPVSFILVFWKSDGGVRRMWTGKRWTSRWESIHFTLFRIYTKVTLKYLYLYITCLLKQFNLIKKKKKKISATKTKLFLNLTIPSFL